uniref:G_PROTEIN_RECEP_F1_2 domain-containing protein n=1 Tax=Heterorhabditis bacteriophora TaxID=37862 RepID=A0A1I7WRG6_HETBA
MDRSPMVALPLLYLCNPNKPSIPVSYSSINTYIYINTTRYYHMERYIFIYLIFSLLLLIPFIIKKIRSYIRNKFKSTNANAIQEQETVILSSNADHHSCKGKDANETHQLVTSATSKNSENDSSTKTTSFNISELTIANYSTKRGILLMIVLILTHLSSACQNGFVRETSNVVCSKFSSLSSGKCQI